MLDSLAVATEEEHLRSAVRLLDEPNRAAFYRQFEEQVKDPDTYAALNFLFITGLHHFYLRQWTRGVLNFSLFVTAIGVMFTVSIGYGLIVLAVVSVCELNALFRSQLIIADYNNRLMARILSEITAKGQ